MYLGQYGGRVTDWNQGSRVAKDAAKVLFRRIALTLGSAHLTLMAALGIWLWSSPQSFGPSDIAICVTQSAELTILGIRVRFGSEVLRIVSLFLYSLFLLPGINLLLPIALFLSFHCWYHTRHSKNGPLLPQNTGQDAQIPSPHVPSESPSTSNYLRNLPFALLSTSDSSIFSPPSTSSSSSHSPGNSPASTLAITSNSQSLPPPPVVLTTIACIRLVLPVYLGLTFLLVVNIIFTMDIELSIRGNQHLQNAEESEWGFGQILALLLVFMPLRDLVEALFRRRQEMQTKLNNALKKAITDKNWEDMSRWIAAKANPNVKADSTPRVSRCQLSCYVLLPIHTDGQTALEVVTWAQNWALARVLVDAEAEVNTPFTGK